MPRDNLVREAFETSIEVLGERARRGLVEDLQHFGVSVNRDDLALEELVKGLEKVLGYEAAEVIIERVILKLDELHSQSG